MKYSASDTNLVQSTMRGRFYFWLVLTMLVLATAACALSSPETLNDGQGTREDPVPPRTYALTTDYSVRAMNVVRESENGDTTAETDRVRMRVQFQIRCEEHEDEVCQLEDIRGSLRLVDGNGVLYEPLFAADIENPLEGEILGMGEKTGWLVYELPRGVDIQVAVAEYSEDQRVFFQLP